jgi:hypothetical protein
VFDLTKGGRQIAVDGKGNHASMEPLANMRCVTTTPPITEPSRGKELPATRLVKEMVRLCSPNNNSPPWLKTNRFTDGWLVVARLTPREIGVNVRHCKDGVCVFAQSGGLELLKDINTGVWKHRTRRTGLEYKCGRCHEYGHNARTCVHRNE